MDFDGNESRQKRDFIDLQNEMSDLDTGRVKRFLPEGRKAMLEKKKEREAREAHTRLMLLLNDPIYRAKYDFTLNRLGEAERAADQALRTLEEHITEAEANLSDVQARAARLPDGTRVYRDEDGVVRREDGTIVEDDLVATISWRGDEPSFEDFRAANDRIEALRIQFEETYRYRNGILGNARDRIEDEDNPPSKDELDDILNDIETKMPEVVSQNMPDTDLGKELTAPLSLDAIPTLPTNPKT